MTRKLLTLPSARGRIERLQLVAPASPWKPRVDRIDPNLPRFLAVPVLFGDRPAWPATAARPISSDGGDGSKAIIAIKDFGRGPLQLSNLRLGEKVLVAGRLTTRSLVTVKGSEFGDFVYECIEGRAGDDGLNLFPLVIKRAALNITIKNSTGNDAGDYDRQSTEPKTSMVDVLFSFPGGISRAITANGATTYEPVIVVLRIAVWEIGASNPKFTKVVEVTGYADTGAFEWRVPYIFIHGTPATWKVGVQVRGFKKANGTAYSPSNATRPKVVWAELTSRGKKSIEGSLGHAMVVVAGNLATLGTDEFLSDLNADAAAELRETIGGSVIKTRSPAAALLDVLQGEGRPDPLPDARIDAATIAAWNAACASEKLSFDFQFGRDGGAGTMDEALRLVAAAGKARYIIRDGLYSVIREPTGDPVALFCPANMRPGFKVIREAFGGSIHGIRCTLENRAQGFRDESFIVYAEGFTAANASKFEDWSFPGTTEKDAIKNLAAYHLSVLAERSLMYEFPVDHNHLRAMRGDLCRVAHYRIRKGLSWGRVWRVISATEIEVSRECPMETGGTYRVLLQQADGTQVFKTAVTIPGTPKRLTTTAAHGAAEGDLFVFGETNEEAETCVVLRVEHEDELQATLTVAPQEEPVSSGGKASSLAESQARTSVTPFVAIAATNGSLGFSVIS